MKITIRDNDYELRQSFRSYMIYEQITQKSFEPKTLGDMLIFFFSNILSATKLQDFTYDEFMDLIDENPQLVTDFSNWLVGVNEANDDTKNKKKKVEKSTKK